MIAEDARSGYLKTDAERFADAIGDDAYQSYRAAHPGLFCKKKEVLSVIP
jgi:hypothetical protein